MSGQRSFAEKASEPVLSQTAVRAAIRRVAIADIALFLLSALSLWFFPAMFVIEFPILVVIFLIGFVAAVVTAVCLSPSTSWIGRVGQAGSMMYGCYLQPPDD
jgi:hypothetical protein